MPDERTMSACDTIDRLINLDFLLRQTVITEFYPAARALHGQPLVYTAAQRLIKELQRGDVVVLTSGNVVGLNFLARGETDGPAGTAILARGLALALGVVPVIAVDQNAGSGMEQVMRAAGFVTTTPDILARYCQETPHGAKRLLATSVVELPPNDDGSETVCRSLFSTFQPKAVIALEKLSWNTKRHYHSSMGTDYTEITGRADYLFEMAEQTGRLRIGIGDGGNEIGFGEIADVVRRFKQYGDVCRCPCQGGIASATGADILITAEVSNWAGYALAAVLLLLVGKTGMIHDDAMEVRLLEATARAGFIHMGSEVGTSVDTFSMATSLRVGGLIRDIAQQVERFNFQEFLKGYTEVKGGEPARAA